MRVYVPLTLPGLARLHRTGQAGPAPLTAYAVTPALRAWYQGGGDEELEYAAFDRAAEASLRLLAAATTAAPDAPDDAGGAPPPRRVVLAADVPERTVQPTPATPDQAPDQDDPGRVLLRQPLPLKRAASVHVDAAEAEAAVAAAVRALTEAARDEPARDEAAARRALDDLSDHELLWYGVQEIGYLLGDLA